MATISIQKFQSHWRSIFEGDMEIPFSERLLSILFYHTDVGQIPRGKAVSISPASSHCNDINWKRIIKGCYWCSNTDTSCQGICCSPACLIYFHEWCVRKVNKTTEYSICLFPGCGEENLDKRCSVCCEKHSKDYTDRYSIIPQHSDTSITFPKWYIDRTEQISHKEFVSSISSNSSYSDVTMKGTYSSLFIFSERLYEGLIDETDVGPIPRDSNREEYLKSPFSDYFNWRVTIEGCYWCGKNTNPNQYTYVCDKKCYQYFHEWCRRKLSEFCGEYLCMYPGCDESVVRDVRFCSETHQNKLEKKFKIIHNLSVGKVVLKMPDWYQEDYTKQRSDTSRTVEHHHNHHQQLLLQQQQHLNREDIETEASKIRTKIETYFSQLIEVIKLRQSTLISELDNIISSSRKERETSRDKMRELEKMRKFHEELYSTSTFNKLQDDFLSRIDTELATLKQTMDSIVIEFEWNQKYASEANNIGKLTCNVIYSAQPLQFRHSSSVSKDTDPIPSTRPRDNNLPQKPKQGTQPNSYTEPQFIKGKAKRPLLPDYNNPFD